MFRFDDDLDSLRMQRLHPGVATNGAAAPSSLFDLEGSIFDGRFRIEERIAEGGFAVVYKAWQLALERRVALKVLKAPRQQDAASRAEFREKFATEAKTIARLRHPDIVDVYDFSVATLPSGELAPWMALEWLEGETLAGELGRRSRAGLRGREPHEAFELLRPLVRALAHAHEQGIVHRDIKPSNIMLTHTRQGPSLRVLDFGIAKIMVDSRAPNTGNTRTESVPAFSPAYAAPEQVAFSRTGPWTDVHALGLILTEVMTDEPPYSEQDPDAHLFEQVMAARRPTPGGKGFDVGPFESVISKALSLSPRERFRNAAELLEALEQAKAGRALAVRDTAPATVSEPSAEREQRAFPRRSAGVALTLATLAVVAGAGWAFSRSRAASVTEADPLATEAPTLAGPRESSQAAGAPGGSMRLGSSPAIALSVAPAPKLDIKEKKRSRAAPVQLQPSDGRELFNDTK
jgi:eukaryotic-like serine/threonine-protein kinase